MKKIFIYLLVVFLLFLFTIGGLGYLVYQKYFYKSNITLPFEPSTRSAQFVAFSSEKDFYDYLTRSKDASSQSLNSLSNVADRNYFSFDEKMMTFDSVMPTASESVSDGMGSGMTAPVPDRYSDTNVQVVGVDEPDIIKTNGQQIFYSRNDYYYPYYAYDYETDFAPDYQEPASQILQVFPPEKLSELSSIKDTGDLLLTGNELIVIGYDGITGYDISSPSDPKESWQYDFNSNTSYVTARLFDNKIYLITRTDMYYQPVCPLPILENSSSKINIACTSIYHPDDLINADATYTILQIDPSTGQQLDNLSFVGSYSDSVVYMSPQSIFVAYSVRENLLNLFLGFLSENPGLFPTEVTDRLDQLNGYDISDSSKLNELNIVIDRYISSLNDDDRLKFDNDFGNAIEEYLTKYKRQLTTSQISKININNFSVEAVGQVAGKLLNQFSMDEFEDHLRIATTIGDDYYPYPFYLSSAETINDVYVLDSNLEISGSVTDLGEGERVYSARFIGDKGYVVTFRETDPFYVFDLSDPKNPQKTGELKIPGYSSYLHPLADNIILGVGKEDSQVKVSLFDVSDPSQPKELDKYTLNEYWSDILDTHHAFLQDAKHEIFFLPGSTGGYIFSYENNKLQLTKALSEISAERAVYINDYLYIVGYDQLIVLDENTWERVGELKL